MTADPATRRGADKQALMDAWTELLLRQPKWGGLVQWWIFEAGWKARGLWQTEVQKFRDKQKETNHA